MFLRCHKSFIWSRFLIHYANTRFRTRQSLPRRRPSASPRGELVEAGLPRPCLRRSGFAQTGVGGRNQQSAIRGANLFRDDADFLCSQETCSKNSCESVIARPAAYPPWRNNFSKDCRNSIGLTTFNITFCLVFGLRKCLLSNVIRKSTLAFSAAARMGASLRSTIVAASSTDSGVGSSIMSGAKCCMNCRKRPTNWGNFAVKFLSASIKTCRLTTIWRTCASHKSRIVADAPVTEWTPAIRTLVSTKTLIFPVGFCKVFFPLNP